MGFETGSDNEKITELENLIDDIIDSQLNSVGGNEALSIDSTLGQRNAASGDAGGVRSNQPIIHNITEDDESGTPTGTFDRINLISSMIIVDHTSTPMDLRFIQGPAKDGAKIKITVKKDKVLVIKSGGNILTSSDITISDNEFYILVKHSEAETGISGGAYKILHIVTGGVNGHIIQDEGTPLTQRANLNFVGADVTVTDDVGNDASVVTISGGVNVGTIENQHLEWNNSTLQWEAKVNLEFGSIGPFADAGQLRFPNDVIFASGRTGADDGNIELKFTTQDELDLTNSNNSTVALLLRAQDPIDPDNLFLISQTSGSGGDAFLTAPNNLAILTNLVTANVLFSPTKALFGTDISLDTNEIFLDADEDSGIVSTVDDTVQIFTNNIIRAAFQDTLITFGTDLTMQSNTILAGGAGEGITNIGRLDFVDNLATPAAALSIYTDGTDIFANTGGGVVNFSDIGGASQTPILQNVDYDDFNIFDISRISQNGTVPTSGFINMANSATLAWESSPAGAVGTLTFSSLEFFTFGGSVANSVIHIDGASLGTIGARWGTLFAVAADLSSSLTVAGTTLLQGDTFLGDASTDQISVTGRWVSSLIPLTDNNVDLGSTTLEWRDLFIDGTANIDTANIGIINSSVTFTGSLINFNSATVNIGDSNSDILNVLADIGTTLRPNVDNAIDLGSTTQEFRDLFIDGTAHIDILDIDVSSTFTGTAIFNDSVTLGSSSGDNLTVNAVAQFVSNVQFDEDVMLGSSNADDIIFNGDVVNSIIPNTDDLYDLGLASLGWRQIYLETQFNLFEGIGVGFTPAPITDTAILFCRPNGTLTELRVIFQTGGSQLIATE